MDNQRDNILKEGDNLNEKVIFSVLNTAYEGQCYQIDPIPSLYIRGTYEVISVNWRPNLNMTLMSSIKVYFTSQYNADGILLTYWVDGDNLDFSLDKYTYTEIGLEEVETVYLQGKSNCSTVEGKIQNQSMENFKISINHFYSRILLWLHDTQFLGWFCQIELPVHAFHHWQKVWGPWISQLHLEHTRICLLQGFCLLLPHQCFCNRIMS